MARDPNERIGPGQWLEKPDDFKSLGIELPQGFVIGTGSGQYYAHYNVHADGHTTIEWYKRGAGGGGEKPDPVETTTAGAPAKTVKDEWDKGNAKPSNVYVGTNPKTGKPTQVTELPDGTKTYDDTQVPASAAAETPIGSRQETDAQGKTVKVTTYRRPDGTTYDRTDSVQAAPEKPQPGKPYQNAQGQWVVPVTDATGTVTTKPLPPEAVPTTPSEDVSAPPTQQWVVRRKGDSYETVLNPNWVKPSRVQWDERTGKWINLTVDDNGKPVIESVASNITIKPAELPVLQARYGEIASGLGQIAQDLNAKFARGEITEQQRDAAWKAAHAQAETAVAEINSILDNSRAVWSSQVTQRGQSLQETQSRRSYAADIATHAMSTGQAIASRSGKGSGAAIAAGVGALMRMGQRYAEGMGGFRESPEIALPAALQQAQGIGLPGFGPPGAPGDVARAAGDVRAPQGPPGAPGLSAGPPGPGGAAGGPNALGLGAVGAMPAPGGPPAVAAPPPLGISNTTDAGGVPREYTPASSGPPGMVPGMGAALQAGQGYGGAPVAAGGHGMFDPMLAAQGMVGDGSDPAWAEAVRRAAQAHAQGGYGRPGM